jgi:hypothetical protein
MVEPIDISPEPLQEPVASRDTAISCLARLSLQNGGAARIEAARRVADLPDEALPLSRLVKLAGEFGLQAEWLQLDWQGLKTAVFAGPLLVVRKNSDVVVVTGGGRSGAEEVSVWDPHHDGVVFFVSREDFAQAWSGHVLIITPKDADANVFKLQPAGETAFATVGNTSPISADLEEQHTPHKPVREARVSKLSRDTGTPRPSLALSFGLTATTIVATAGIAVFLLTPPGADSVVGPSASAPEEPTIVSGISANRREAAPSAGVLANAPVVSTGGAASASATPSSAGPADVRDDTSPPGGEASPAALRAETNTSTVAVPAAPVPQTPVAATTAVSAEPQAATVLSAPEIAALLAHGDALFRKGDLVAARLFYERAADAGDGQSAIRLGETFDPVFLDHAQLRGARGDMGKALSWYRRARDLGASKAKVLLEGLEAEQE